MATSGSANWALTRDEIIGLALRRCSAFAKGETPGAQDVTDAAMTLNAIVKEWAADGMPLWKISTFTITPVASTASYQIKSGGTVNRYPPLRIIQAWYQNTSTNADTPLNLVTRDEYNLLSPKTQTGTPNQLYYNPPGNQGNTSQEPSGTVYLYNVPDSAFVASNTIYCVGEFMFEDFDASGDYPDFPSNFNNALAWQLALELSHEYGVPPQQRAQLKAQAKESKTNALLNGAELGSMFIVPDFE